MYATSKHSQLKKTPAGESGLSERVPLHSPGTVNTDPAGASYMIIPLTKGYSTIVDTEDYKFLMQWKWCVNINKQFPYAQRSINYRKLNGKWTTTVVKMHRAIMNPAKNMVIDHINHNTLDNRKSNLKICTHRENMMNLIIKNKNGFIGVNKSHKKFKAMAMVDGKVKQIGRFDTSIEAHNAYMDAVSKIINGILL
jgi:hypothetical protein